MPPASVQMGTDQEMLRVAVRASIGRVDSEVTRRAQADPSFIPRLNRELLQRYSCLATPAVQQRLADGLAAGVRAAAAPSNLCIELNKALFQLTRSGNASCGICTPPIAGQVCISAAPDYHATCQNEELWLHMVAAASWLLAAPQLELAAAAVAVIGSTVEEPVPSNISAFTISLNHRILRALQRPGLVAAACAMVPAAALNIAAAVVLERAHHRHDASVLALCTGPAAVDFVVTRTYSSRGNSSDDGTNGSGVSGHRGHQDPERLPGGAHAERCAAVGDAAAGCRCGRCAAVEAPGFPDGCCAPAGLAVRAAGLRAGAVRRRNVQGNVH